MMDNYLMQIIFLLLSTDLFVSGFQATKILLHSTGAAASSLVLGGTSPIVSETGTNNDDAVSRRQLFLQGLTLASVLAASPQIGNAAVGTLPEFEDTNAILQGITIQVADKSQQDAMVQFLANGFDFEILRQRIEGGKEEIWMGFGPEQLSIPEYFVAGPSSFNTYGGHSSICILYDPSITSALYRIGSETAPGDNIEFLQVAVPGYRISQMVKSGGKILDAYGIVNAMSPSGLPVRGIVGISPDPIMFVAINCANVKESKSFYQQLGFVEQEYPYARPNKGMGQFEPLQPQKSVYLAPSKNSMGVLLLQSKKKNISVNPVVRSLNIVYTPSTGSSSDGGEVDSVLDPSGVSLAFQSVGKFEAEEKLTR